MISDAFLAACQWYLVSQFRQTVFRPGDVDRVGVTLPRANTPAPYRGFATGKRNEESWNAN